ncbi:MAG TPA: class I SAM-dependent methyltransferase, partial [Chloroflexota bacterium]
MSERNLPPTYGDEHASLYDAQAELGLLRGTRKTVDTLAAVAGKGPVLELGVGTGRIAIPLAERGLEVHGIDLSEAMVSRMRSKPGG